MRTERDIGVVNPNCRKCGRPLIYPDILVGLCNSDEACARRVAAKQAPATPEHVEESK
jgi:exosome complex RNA-binding protein Csl4